MGRGSGGAQRYAKRIGPLTTAAFDRRMLNVHPAPLREFGGQGMYGMAVHEAVLSSDRQEMAIGSSFRSGAT